MEQTRASTGGDYAFYWRRFWDAEPRSYEEVSPGERSRIDAVVALLPADVTTILDVGCGDGLLTNRLNALGFDVTGVDIEPLALQAVDGPTRVGSADAIPAEDREFDCVLVCDVLEHLPRGPFEAALAELARVSRRYLLVNSPHDERLVVAQTRCGRCETTFHSSRHVRSITSMMLDEWFPEFGLEQVLYCGEVVRPRAVWLQRLGQLAANNWYLAPAAVCPNCGYSVEPPTPRRALRLAFAAAHRLVGLIRRPRATEFAARLVRRELQR